MNLDALYLICCISISLQCRLAQGRSVDASHATDLLEPVAGKYGEGQGKETDDQEYPLSGVDEEGEMQDQERVWSRNHYRRGGVCILDMNKDLPKKNEPLFLKRGPSGKLDLLMPKMEGRRGVIFLRKGEHIVVSCPGKGNSIEATKNEISSAVCQAGNELTIKGKRYSSLSLNCKERASAVTKPTQKRCAGGKGIIVDLGFDVGDRIPIIISCHDIENSNTFYSKHTIYGAILGGKVYRTTARPRFSRGDRVFFKGFNPEHAYTQRNQLTVLSRYLGDDQAKNMLDYKKTLFIARGHLAPDADFIFSAHQFLTYFYVNIAPQWQSINAGNWLKVEDNSRKIARKLGADIEVVTGTYGLLKLSGAKGIKEVRLQGKSLPIPDNFWKVLRNTQDDSCIAFVATNNPFLTQKPKHICRDICAQAGWPVLQSDLAKGYVYCCQYQDLKKVIPEMPDLACKSVLRG